MGLGGLADRAVPGPRVRYAALRADRLVASSAAKGRSAALARDGKTETYWAPATPGDGTGQSIEATFAQPFRLVFVQIFNGASRDDGAYLKTGRPAKVAFSVTRADGTVWKDERELRDDPEQQDLRIGVSDVISVRLTITQSRTTTPRTPVALAEMAFLTRS